MIPTTVYAELTPNPKSMKFVADRLITSPELDGFEYSSIQEAKGSSNIAEALFAFPFVKQIFIASNFVSVTHNGTIEWEMVHQELREFISDYLRSHEIIIQAPPAIIEQPVNAAEDMVKTTNVKAEINTEEDKKIVEVLEEYIKPAVERDGGAIDFVSFKEGIVSVNLRGSCSGCPSASATLKNGIETLLIDMVPGVKEVVAYEI